jgi:hypothetical protein
MGAVGGHDDDVCRVLMSNSRNAWALRTAPYPTTWTDDVGPDSPRFLELPIRHGAITGRPQPVYVARLYSQSFKRSCPLPVIPFLCTSRCFGSDNAPSTASAPHAGPSHVGHATSVDIVQMFWQDIMASPRRAARRRRLISTTARSRWLEARDYGDDDSQENCSAGGACLWSDLYRWALCNGVLRWEST